METPGSAKKRVIWDPHHTIDIPELPYANFLNYAGQFVALAGRHKDKIQWAFKPHPLLKSKLYRAPGWGKSRTNAFFDFWKNSDFCQLEEGRYVDLFHQSDAMIHDSASFMAEYLYLDKPVMFLQAVDNIGDFVNGFGRAAFEACEHARRWEHVEGFVEGLLSGKDKGAAKRSAFHDDNIKPYFDVLPSQKIVDYLKATFPRLPKDTAI